MRRLSIYSKIFSLIWSSSQICKIIFCSEICIIIPLHLRCLPYMILLPVMSIKMSLTLDSCVLNIHSANFHALQSSIFSYQLIKMLCQFVTLFRRNGKWYSDAYDGHCYFKSTDGHESSWSFSLSRMNLEFARVAAQRSGAVVVDSTRMGKAFPDSMTATVREQNWEIEMHEDW